MTKPLLFTFFLVLPVLLFAAGPQMPGSYPEAFSITPDNQLLAVGYSDGILALFDIESGALKGTVKTGKSPIKSVAISPNGLLLAGGDDSGSIHIVEMSTLKKKSKLKASGSASVLLMAFSPDSGKLAAAVDDDIALLVFDVSSGKTVSTFPRMSAAEEKYAREKNDFRLLKGGYDQIAWSGEGSLYTWRRMTRYIRVFSPAGQPVKEMQIEGYYKLMYIPALDKVMAHGLISTAKKNEIQLLTPADLAPAGPIYPLGVESSDDPRDPMVSPDGRYILVVQQSPNTVLHIYTLEPFAKKVAIPLSGRAVRTNSDGSLIVWYDSAKKSMILMDWSTQTVTKEIPVRN